jgi:nicotinamidase-related amidase
LPVSVGVTRSLAAILTKSARGPAFIFFVTNENIWKYIAPIQKAAWLRKSIEYGTWGGEIRREFEPQPGEIVALEHWGSSGFANTELDLQPKKHGINQLISN